MKNFICIRMKIVLLILLTVLADFYFNCSGQSSDKQILKNLKYVSGQQEFKKNDALPRILSIVTRPNHGGIITLLRVIYDAFLKKGYDIILLVAQGSMMEDELKKNGLSYYSIDTLKYKCKSQEFKNLLSAALFKICKERKIDIVHCHKDYEYETVKNVAHKLNIASIAHYHSFLNPKTKIIKGFDAFVASSPYVVEAVKAANQNDNLGIKFVEFIYPPHDEDKFLNFSPHQARSDFFEMNFGINVGELPIICVIANLDTYKNPILLLNALDILIHQEKIPVCAIWAGSDSVFSAAKLMEKATELHIQDYIHFIGFTYLVPELLYYSDIKVLPSKGESFGIALVEAALMKKPIILSGAADFAGVLIKHEQTGLVAKANSPSDFACQIKRLIKDRQLGTVLGENACQLVLDNFSTKVAIDKLEKVYQDLYTMRKNPLDDKNVAWERKSAACWDETNVNAKDALWQELKNFIPQKNRNFLIIIPSYNNKEWYKKNLDSVFMQDYPFYKVICVDDCSTDGTGDLVEKYVNENKKEAHFVVVKNKERIFALANIYASIYRYGADDDIVLILDGDDWFAHDHVLTLLNKVYDKFDVWMTYGQYETYPEGKIGISRRVPDEIVKTNNFRSYKWVTSQQRTFYVWLFKLIKKEDLLYDKKFLFMSGDLGVMFPMLEMAGRRSMFIQDVIYIYNRANPLNLSKHHQKIRIGKFIRSKRRYKPLEKRSM